MRLQLIDLSGRNSNVRDFFRSTRLRGTVSFKLRLQKLQEVLDIDNQIKGKKNLIEEAGS